MQMCLISAGRVRNLSDNNKGRARASRCLMRGEVWTSLRSGQALSLLAFCSPKGTQASACSTRGAPSGTDGFVSCNVDRGSFRCVSQRTAEFEETRMKENKKRASYLEFDPVVLPAEVP